MSTVLITGASSGLGLDLAKLYAQKGKNLILVSSSLLRLRKAKAAIEQEIDQPVSIRLMAQDLSQPEAAQKVMDQIDEPIDVFINNAARGYIGSYQNQTLEDLQSMNRLNIGSAANFLWLVLQRMEKQKKGQILNVCSIGSFTPGPYTAAYYASKSWLLSLSLALRQEAKSRNVQICAFCPGTMKTGFFEKAGSKTPGYGQTPKQAALAACKGLEKNKAIIYSSPAVRASLLIPARLRMKMIERLKKNSQ